MNTRAASRSSPPRRPRSREFTLEPEFDTLLQQRAAEPFRPRVGRNTPCPCGSGRKYKKCHLADDEAEHARLQATAQTHAIDEQLLNRLSRFAVQTFGPAWEAFEDDFADPDEAMQLALPWSVYCFEVEGTTVVDAYLDARGRRCSQEERSRLDAQRAAWKASRMVAHYISRSDRGTRCCRKSPVNGSLL